jgi:hypothetical protein
MSCSCTSRRCYISSLQARASSSLSTKTILRPRADFCVWTCSDATKKRFVRAPHFLFKHQTQKSADAKFALRCAGGSSPGRSSEACCGKHRWRESTNHHGPDLSSSSACLIHHHRLRARSAVDVRGSSDLLCALSLVEDLDTLLSSFDSCWGLPEKFGWPP